MALISYPLRGDRGNIYGNVLKSIERKKCAHEVSENLPELDLVTVQQIILPPLNMVPFS
jgi:hypothetical protein